MSALAVVALAYVLPNAAASAATVVVGSPLYGEFGSTLNVAGLSTTATNTALGEPGANVTSPVSGTIVRWRTKGKFAGGGFRIRVLRPIGGGGYVGAGAGAFATPLGISLQTFPADVPIQAGDLIGLDAESQNATYSLGNASGSAYTLFSPSFLEAGSSTPVATNTQELGFDAEVVPTPTVILVGPASGPLSGGTTVTIAGRDLEGATAVKFGSSAAAADFTVLSDDEITAVAPPGAAPGPVDVTVTTVGGVSAPVAGDRFTYVAAPSPASSTSPPVAVSPTPPPTCTVPDLIGKHLAGAGKALGAAGCKLGTVTKARGATRKAGRVIREAPKPGTKVAAGTKVSVRLGAGHR